jgi:hypothetical protein
MPGHQDMVEKLYKNFTFYAKMLPIYANISKGTINVDFK